MTTPTTAALLAYRILRDEGPQAVRNRVIDRYREYLRRKRLVRIDLSSPSSSAAFSGAGVVNVSPLPPSPARGGSQLQMLDRLTVERKWRTVVLAYPQKGRWWLEAWSAGQSTASPLNAGPEAFQAITRAAELVGTDIVHLENPYGLPINLTDELSTRKIRVILSVHDFSLFCSRPHLVERGTDRFCAYCVDHDRCGRCLGPQALDHPNQHEYRRVACRTLGAATALVFPSRFLRDQYMELFSTEKIVDQQFVIAPASFRNPAGSHSNPKHPKIAFVGGVYPHKGGHLIPEIMRRIREDEERATGTIYGNGDSALLQNARREPHLTIAGYYRRGTLPNLLSRDRISVAILPSIWPEAYALVVDECISAGVPVVAFNLGAVGYRLSRWKTGRLALPDQGPGGLARAAVETIRSTCPLPEGLIDSLPSPYSAARAHLDLYTALRATGQHTAQRV